MEYVWIKTGPRKQKFCCSRCKNKAKDMRRGEKRSRIRFRNLCLEFKVVWGDRARDALDRLGVSELEVKEKILETIHHAK